MYIRGSVRYVQNLTGWNYEQNRSLFISHCLSKYVRAGEFDVTRHLIVFHLVVAETKRMTMETSKAHKPGVMAWIDLELTGLDIDTCHILEVACLISDVNLDIVGEELHIVVHQPDSILDNMSSWCINMHGKTGLTRASRESKITVKDAERMILAHLKKYTVQNKCIMAGSTVYMDRIFINKYMPSINNYLHYRLIDVSTLKELTRIWKPEVMESAPQKTLQHKAITDIKESINELKHYRQHLFK